MDKVKANANKFFSAGLGRGGSLAAWLVAFGAVGAYTYYENKDNGKTFSKEEQQKWNLTKEKSPVSAEKEK